MASLNRVILMGYLGKNPEIRTTNKGREIGLFSLATSQSWLNKATNEWQTDTQWHNIIVFNEYFIKHLKENIIKGDRVYIEGELRTNKFTNKDGYEVEKINIILQGFTSKLEFLSRKNNDSQTSNNSQTSSAPNIPEVDNRELGNNEHRAFVMEIDDEIPF